MPNSKNSSHIQIEVAVIQIAMAIFGSNTERFFRVFITITIARASVGIAIQTPKTFNCNAQLSNLLPTKKEYANAHKCIDGNVSNLICS